MTPRSCIEIIDDGVVVTHRGRSFGPFEYQWSNDLGGIELLFEGCKFGEYCNPDELFADLREFRLPMNVCRAATIALGIVVAAVLSGMSRPERLAEVRRLLSEHGLSHFLVVGGDSAEDPVS